MSGKVDAWKNATLKNATLAGAALALCAAAGCALQAAQSDSPPPATTTSSDAESATKKDSKVSAVAAVLKFKMKSLAGKDVDLSKYKGRVVMLVNVASQCGFTPQYAALQALHKKYATKGLTILGFPANDFGSQEPGSDEEISDFCRKNYGVEFDMFSKIAVTGTQKHPLYKLLTETKTDPEFAGEVGWNFEKFLVGRDGRIVARFKSGVAPASDEIKKAVETALAKK